MGMPKVKASTLVTTMRRWLRRSPPAGSAGLPVPPPSLPEAPRTDPRIDVLLLEWQDARVSIRHGIDHALAQIGLFLGLSAALLAAALLAFGRSGAPAPARLVTPALGIALCVLFQALHSSVIGRVRAFLARAMQIETAVQLLVPGIGHVKTLALCSEPPSAEAGWVRRAQLTGGVLFGASLLGWLVLLIIAGLSAFA